MSLKERIYSVLVVSAAESFNSSLPSMLPENAFEPVTLETSLSAAKRSFSNRSYDFVIVNSPLPDGNGAKLAVDISASSQAVVLLLVRSEYSDAAFFELGEHGVFVLPKPTSKVTFQMALGWLASARERLRRAEKKTLSFEEKMEEIRLVNRAKWLLISEEHMQEPEAHRSIEKQAMDRCVTRREIASEIIKEYE